MPPSYEYHCTECAQTTIEIHPISNRPSTIKCKACGEMKAEYRMSAPTVLKASFLDGQRKLTDLKETNKLNAQKREARSSEERKRIAQEIKKIGIQTTKPGE